MDHYEELGVGRDARTEEIRQAYKTLVRLLHPDSQADEKLKAAADRQMQRLNEILGILTDSERRRAYDAGLVGPRSALEAPWQGEGRRPGRPLPGSPLGRVPSIPGPVASRGAEWVQSAARYWFWVLLGATCVSTATMWWVMPTERNVPEVLPVRPARGPVRAPILEGAGPEVEPKRNRGVAAKGRAREEQYPPQAFVDPAARNQEAGPAFPDPLMSAGVNWQAPQPPAEAVEARPVGSKASVDRKSEESRFAGTWLYTPPEEGEATDPGAYPAVYVELRLVEEHGDLVGSYRAKYNVPDKAISPEVVLRIQGRSPLGKSVHAEWTSSTGAKGVLEMTLRLPGQMSVAWWTTEFGRQLQLTSGSVVLVRQQAP